MHDPERASAGTPPPESSEFPPEQILVGRRTAALFVALFVLLLAGPPLIQDLLEFRKGEDGWLPGRELVRALRGGDGDGRKGVAARLRDFEAGVARLGFTETPRRAAQQAATGVLGRGNDRTVPGRDGWLFFRPEIEALTGYGPLQAEPHSVSRDPSLLSWNPAPEPIVRFARALRDRGVDLWLVPAPMKPSIYPEKLTGGTFDAPVVHRDAEAFRAMLEGEGVRVLDPSELLWRLKAGDGEEGPVYLRHDTHWSPRGMQAVAEMVAGQVRSEAWFPQPAADAVGGGPEPVPAVPGFGDLVEKLDPLDPDRLFERESVPLLRITDARLAAPDRSSPVVLLGDSFVNIFDDPTLGYVPAGLAERERIGAGFAQHLARNLGMSLDVHARNGEGASGVRAAFARRGESVVRSKKLVIWVIAARDLFLGRTAARRNGVEWEIVEIAPDPETPPPDAPDGSGEPADGPWVVEATVLEKSTQPDPRRANYPDSLYVVKYGVNRVVSGPSAEPGTILYVVHWNFRGRKPLPSASLEAGTSQTLTLTPWDDRIELQTLNLSDDFDDPDPRWYAGE